MMNPDPRFEEAWRNRLQFLEPIAALRDPEQIAFSKVICQAMCEHILRDVPSRLHIHDAYEESMKERRAAL